MTIFDFGGGINEINDIAISPKEAITGQNFELGLGNTKFKRRAPFDLLDTATNSSNIHGLHQLITRADVKTTLVAAGTDMYKWDGAIFTDVGNVDADSEFHDIDWDLDETIVIVDRIKENPVLEWDGTTLAALTHGIGGVTNFYAKYGEVMNGRMVLANVTTDAIENPHMVVFSAFENRQLYDTSARSGDSGFTTGLEAFYLLSPDLRPINGMVQFKRSLIISTSGREGRLFELVGDDSTNYRWEPYYAGSNAVGNDSFINSGDDVFYIRNGGVIESLRATVTYGDVGTDDASLPVRNTMKNNTGARIVYDQTNRKVLFFLGSSVLVLFKDLIGSDLSPYSIYKTAHVSSFQTSAAVYMELPDSTDKTVLFGDSLGNIYNLNGEGLAGDSGTTSINAKRKLPLQGASYQQFLEGRVFYRRKGECDLNISFEWGDEKNTTGITIPLKGFSGVDNTNYWNSGLYWRNAEYWSEGLSGGGIPATQGFSAIGKGSSVFVELQIDTVNEFEIDLIETPGEAA